MTAKFVDGVAVVASEPATSAWTNRKTGEPLQFRQMLKLLLEDGREVFGCLHCDYTHPNLNSVRPHLGKHRIPDLGNGLGGFDLASLVKQLSDLGRLEAERDSWRQRALTAERELRKIRGALR